jgi:sugar transferase (PEP-CTERM/EpsH1 system associated)
MRTDLLLLCHRIPFPPDKGDKIRSYHWLTALAQEYSVHLVAFVDDPADLAHVSVLQALCKTCRLFLLNRRWAIARSARGLWTGDALSLPYYQDHRIALWLAELKRTFRIDTVLVYSSAVAPYVMSAAWSGSRRVIDFVDVDSDKWMQYANSRVGPSRWFFRREGRRLATFEGLVSRTFDLSLLVSPQEVALFRAHQGGGGLVDHVSNGVDSQFFAPARDRPSPYGRGGPVAVFTGAMDYWANSDAVTWFAATVWPVVRRARPDARFFVVGANPTPDVMALGASGVVVTGRVPDVRPYLQHAAVVVAPLRIARGIQNKVLEGLAMARPVVLTDKALEGIEAGQCADLRVADTSAGLAARVLEAFDQGDGSVGEAGRELVVRHYSWEQHSRRFLQLVRGHAA